MSEKGETDTRMAGVCIIKPVMMIGYFEVAYVFISVIVVMSKQAGFMMI